MNTTIEKNFTIDEIESLTESEASSMAMEKMEIKEHNIYFVDLGEYFGYSVLVFKNNHHIYHADDYELHHKSVQAKEELRSLYINKMNHILFTEKEIAEPIRSYDEYSHKSYFLHNYYGMQIDYISIFGDFSTDEKRKKYKEKTKNMVYNPVGFCYMNDREFVNHHIELLNTLEKMLEQTKNDFEYNKSAFLYEMYNHEYGINWQADYDTLSAFGNIHYHDDDIDAYFNELGFTETQRRAYEAARREYFTATEKSLY